MAVVLGLVVVVALAAFFSACPRRPAAPEAGTAVDLREVRRAEVPASPVASAAEPIVAPPPPAAAVASAPSPVAAPVAAVSATPPAQWDLTIPGAETVWANGAFSIRFSDPVFVSADLLSPEGLNALRALGAKLRKLPGGATVVVTGHTDDVPLSRPTPQFRNNSDLAQARAKAAREHLAHLARATRALVFEERVGTFAEAPYPNDSPRNRRLNRTATVRVVPANN